MALPRVLIRGIIRVSGSIKYLERRNRAMNSLTVIFDVGGTLLSSPDLHHAIATNLLDRESDRETRDFVEGIFVDITQNQKPYRRVEERIAATLAVMAREYGYQDISSRTHDIYDDVFFLRSYLFPETPDALEILHAHSVRMIIASDADAGLVDAQVARHHLEKYFAEICTSDQVEAFKPSSKYVELLKKYVLDNEENCYFVGDGIQDVECGRRLGIKSVLVDRRGSNGDTGADYVIPDLSGLVQVLSLEQY